VFPDWRHLAIHESSPAARGISTKLQRECERYVASHYFPNAPWGSTVYGFRNENLENQTFVDESFNIVLTLDVMEHVNDPEQVVKEVARTIRPGGAYIFTTPTYKGEVTTVRRARYRLDGSVEHLVTPAEYHGNPISEQGVTGDLPLWVRLTGVDPFMGRVGHNGLPISRP
jgi:SAM-dependent methyltransferase